MYSRQSLHAHELTDVAIGVGADGRYKTSAHKEYPPDFCNAPAGTLIDEIARRNDSEDCRGFEDINSDLLLWLREAQVQCGTVRDTSWLPDYKGS